MNEENMQEENGGMKTDDLRAALGFSNNMLSQMLPQDEMEQAPEGSETPEMAPSSPVEQEKEEPLDKEALKKELREELKKELIEEVKKEVMGEIKSALDESDE